MPPHLLTEPALAATVAATRETVLIVDEDANEVETLSSRLQQQGFAVMSVGSGRAAREAAHRDHPDLIVLDLRLPDIDGFTLCQELADAPDTRSTPVILMSGMIRPDIIRRSRPVGCEYFVRKPCDPHTLLTLIRRSIDETRQAKPAANLSAE